MIISGLLWQDHVCFVAVMQYDTTISGLLCNIKMVFSGLSACKYDINGIKGGPQD